VIRRALRFVLALHNHQPIGNFGNVIEAAYHDSYAPFLEVIEQYPDIPFCLHTSGCLMEWLAEHQPSYVTRLREMVGRGQVEILGGGFYEPILPMIPPRDRVGQIAGYSAYLEDLLETSVRGMWMAERVWEQSLTSDLVQAGIEYTILDDFHFRQAGLSDSELNGYFTTENQGDVLRLFPGSEPMRYMIPFQEVDHCIHWLRLIYDRHPHAVVVFADDGEKFGTWPNTKSHVYERGWLVRFLNALRGHQDWIDVTTLAACVDSLPSAGHLYVPDASYREMTEWVLPADRSPSYEAIRSKLGETSWQHERASFVRAGYWRNFKAKYPETREMYARMMEISGRLDRLIREDRQAVGDHRLYEARRALYRGQCNCPYWHGAFGGLYLPHLRSAIYEQLLGAEKALDQFEHADKSYLNLSSEDFDFDGVKEIKLANNELAVYLSPQRGGSIYELDVLDVTRNLAASLTRRPEAYHAKIRQDQQLHHTESAQSIHDGIRCKEEGLDRHLVYDAYRRGSLIEHLLPGDVAIESAHDWAGQSFLSSWSVPFRSRTVKAADRISVELQGTADILGQPVIILKQIELERGKSSLSVRYRLSGIDRLPSFRMAIEWNIAGLATGAADRYFTSAEGERWGLLGDEIAIEQTHWLGLVDEWIGIDVGLGSRQPASFVAYPISTVSQSESGFERVHQQITLVQYWDVPVGTAEWSAEVTLSADTSRARSRRLPLRKDAATSIA
jgi:4-alpha-glucanotransferase